MDGALIAIIVSGVTVGGGIVATLIRLSRSVGHLEGKIDGFDKRIDRLDKRMNGWLDTMCGKEEENHG